MVLLVSVINTNQTPAVLTINFYDFTLGLVTIFVSFNIGGSFHADLGGAILAGSKGAEVAEVGVAVPDKFVRFR